MYYCAEKGIPCKLANINGYCSITACVETVSTSTGIISSTTTIKPDTIVFPHTIGNITFYSSKELIKWVEYQQEINKRIMNT